MNEQVESFIKNVRLAKLVLKLVNQPDQTIQPEVNPVHPLGYGYPLAEEYLGKAAREELENMANQGLFERQFVSKELGCPKDHSINLSLKRHCAKCDSTNIIKQELIEHIPCGNVSPESTYKDGKCPKCNRPIGKLGVEYIKHGAQFVCQNCGSVLQNAVDKAMCLRDKHVFMMKDAVEVDLYSYKITDRLKEEANKMIDQQRFISDKVRALGFKVQSPATLKGRSGVDHDFFMVAASGLGFLAIKVIVELIGDAKISKDDVFGVYAKAIDVGARGILVGAIPRMTEEAKAIAESYQIAFVEAGDLAEVAEKLVDKFAQLIESPEERIVSVITPGSSK